MDSPSVAVVILNWNGKKYLEQFLPYLVETEYENLQLVVADNASTDDSVAFLKQYYPGIRILQHTKNEGFANGYNSALAKVEADYFVLLNSDVEVTRNWIRPVISLMEARPAIGACQPKMLDWRRRDMFEYAGAAGGWLDAFGYPFCRGRIFDYCELDLGQFDQATPVFWASGAALFVRSSVYRELGGFDPFFFAHQEEIDLCWRMQLAGHGVYACPQSVIYHVGGGTLPKGNERKVFLNFRNNLVMLYKNLPWRIKWWKIPFRIMLDAVSAWKNIFLGEPHYFWAVLKAHWAFAGWMLFSKSKSLFPTKRIYRPSGLYKGNIAWDHFVKGKKGFREIVGFNN